MIRSAACLLALCSSPWFAACGPIGARSPRFEAVLRTDWESRPDGVWIGERFWANRLQDWRLEGGAARCVEGRRRFGFRTLHALTHRLDGAGDGSFRTSVLVDAGAGERRGSAAGFLVGAGGEHVDHRLTAHVAGAPAEDGGVLAVLDGAGRVRFCDFEVPGDAGGTWVLRSDAELDALAELPAALDGVGFGDAGPRPVRLELVGARFGGLRTLTLTAREAATGAVLSTAYLESAPETAFDGSVALVSHRGPTVDPAEGRPFGYAFRRWELTGELVARDDARAFGPLLFVHYSVDESGVEPVLRLVAQAAPLGVNDGRTATLELMDERSRSRARTVATAQLDPDARTFTFVVAGGFDPETDTRFEVVHVPHDADGEPAPRRTQRYGGVVPARPEDGVLDVALLSCQKSFTGGLRWNEGGFWFPHADVARGVEALEPDLLYFAGDQIYEGDVTPAVRAPEHEALLDYLGKWYRHGWSFGELTRSVPSVVTPDDHDVYHGNIWGNAGVALEAPDGRTLSAQDRGGYTMSARFVNAVHRTQTGHLPPPVDPAPLAGGVLPFHTTLSYAGGSFAILSDRMYKSPPAVVVPDGAIVNGWATAPDWDARASSDVPGAELLGASQEALLARWGSAPARETEWFRAVLSQTPFVNLATLPAGARTGAAIPGMAIADRGAYMAGDRPAQDMDSGGWPRTARDRAVGLLRDACAFHLAGDQHLASVVRYGVEEFDDAPFVFTAPAVANTWPRRWFPNPRDRAPRGEERPVEAGAEREPPYTGRYLDGFGNRMTVHAVANPRRTELEPTRLNDRVPGYGAVRVRRLEGDGGAEVTFTAWPRWEVPTEPDARPYGGWPVRTTLPPLERR